MRFELTLNRAHPLSVQLEDTCIFQHLPAITPNVTYIYSILGTSPDKAHPDPRKIPPINVTFRNEKFLLSKLAIGPEKNNRDLKAR